MWFPLGQVEFVHVFFAARVRHCTPESILPGVPAAVQRWTRSCRSATCRRWRHATTTALTAQRLAMRLFQLFSALTLVLAASGLYGLLAYLVHQRRKELSIRAAVGATRVDLAQVVLRESLAMAGAGGIVCFVALPLASAWWRALTEALPDLDVWAWIGIVQPGGIRQRVLRHEGGWRLAHGRHSGGALGRPASRPGTAHQRRADDGGAGGNGDCRRNGSRCDSFQAFRGSRVVARRLRALRPARLRRAPAPQGARHPRGRGCDTRPTWRASCCETASRWRSRVRAAASAGAAIGRGRLAHWPPTGLGALDALGLGWRALPCCSGLAPGQPRTGTDRRRARSTAPHFARIETRRSRRARPNLSAG